jgi:IS5 family transposase
LKKKDDEALKGRCGSFVVETHVEYPTDTGMLWGAMRKSILLISTLCQHYDVDGCRQVSYNILRLKSHWRKAQRSNRSRQAHAQEKKIKAHKTNLRVANQYFERTQSGIQQLREEVSQQLSPEAWPCLQYDLEKIRVF